MNGSDGIGQYLQHVVMGDQSWREDSACRGASPQIVSMFTCTEDEVFEVAGRNVPGYDVQVYLVEAYCRTCPVQWECARHAIEVEEAIVGDRSTGAWAMTRRDRRWLSRQPEPLKFIDQARIDGVPVATAVAVARDRDV